MLRFVCVCYLVLAASLFTSFSTREKFEKPIDKPATTESTIENNGSLTMELYERFELGSLLPYEAFERALLGYHAIENRKKDILTIIDFSKPSTEERMFVLDMKKEIVLFQTIVSHGRNSGENYARKFSNRHGSFQSSLGFYLTAGTYMGGNGYSLIIDGLEKGINDQARARAVVIHGADYCSKEFIQRNGRLGRSYGCPALPRALNNAIIDTIKNGSLLYIYAEDEQYALHSPILKEATSSKAAASLAHTRYL